MIFWFIIFYEIHDNEDIFAAKKIEYDSHKISIDITCACKQQLLKKI